MAWIMLLFIGLLTLLLFKTKKYWVYVNINSRELKRKEEQEKLFIMCWYGGVGTAYVVSFNLDVDAFLLKIQILFFLRQKAYCQNHLH